MNPYSKIESIRKKVEKELSVNDVWYVFDWSEWSAEELRVIADGSKEMPDHLSEKIKLTRVYPDSLVNKDISAYISLEAAKELEKDYPNVKL